MESLEPETIVAFRASNPTYGERFSQLNSYLLNKNMWGIVNSFYLTLYLIPFGPYTKKYAPMASQGDIIGIFLNAEDNEEEEEVQQNEESFD